MTCKIVQERANRADVQVPTNQCVICMLWWWWWWWWWYYVILVRKFSLKFRLYIQVFSSPKHNMFPGLRLDKALQWSGRPHRWSGDQVLAINPGLMKDGVIEYLKDRSGSVLAVTASGMVGVMGLIIYWLVVWNMFPYIGNNNPPQLTIIFLVSTLLRGRALSSFFSSSVCLLSLCLLAWFWGGGGNVNVHCDCKHTVRCLALPHMLRCCTFSCTSTHTSCYAAARSLALPHTRHPVSGFHTCYAAAPSGGSKPAQRCLRSWDSWRWMYKSWISGCACDCLKLSNQNSRQGKFRVQWLS